MRELCSLLDGERTVDHPRMEDVFDTCDRFADALEIRLSEIVHHTSRDVRQEFESLKFRSVRAGTLHAAE